MVAKKEILEELGRLAEKWPEREIVCVDDDEVVSFIKCVELNDWDEPWQYILTTGEVGDSVMTAARLVECLSEGNSDNSDPTGEVTDVLVYLDEEDGPRYIDGVPDRIFFEYTVDGEKVIAFRAGDEAEIDYGFRNDVD